MDQIASCCESEGNGSGDSWGQLSMLVKMQQQQMSWQQHMQQFQSMQIQMTQFQQSIHNQMDSMEHRARKSDWAFKNLLSSKKHKNIAFDLDKSSNSSGDDESSY